MKWAGNKYREGLRKKAIPKDTGFCPICGEEVIAKCGDIKIWHWAHKSGFECDSFGEPETKWHLEWKDNFPEERQEVIIEKNIIQTIDKTKPFEELKKHVADVKTKNGLILEFQNSPISPKKIHEREWFYGNMIWILNGKTLAKNLIYYKKRFKWKWYPSSWDSAFKDIYIDEGDEFLYKLEDVGKLGEFTRFSKNAFIIEHGGKPF